MRTKTRYRKLQAFAAGGAVLVEAPIPDAPIPSGVSYDTPDPVIEPDELEQSGLPDSAKAWLRKPENSRYLYDENASAKLAALHFEVVDSGHEAYSPSYWKRLEARLEQPPARPDVDPEAVEKVLAEARRSAPKPKVEDDAPRIRYQAPPSKETTMGGGYWSGQSTDPRSVSTTLTREQKEFARISGVSDLEYSKQLIKLREHKARGDYGGSP